MKEKQLCPQQWQAEAVEDGRLSGVERAAFERHAMHCEFCGREIEQLAKLREIMTQASVAASSPFEQKRLRMDLLKQADSVFARSKTFPVRRAVAFAMAAAACVLMAIFSARLGMNTIAAPAFDVVASGPARWTSERRGAMAHVSLTDGAVWVHVERTRSEQKFVLTMPDGDIEVHGTRFLTVVGKGSTNRVQVTEGVVSLRLRGEPDRTLRAGDAWDRPIVEETPVAAIVAPSVAPSVPTKAIEGRPARAARSTDDTNKAPAEPEIDPFVSGVQAFRGGDYAAADDLLARFVREMPADSRIEDATFLRAVANARQGKKATAADLARSYLNRFPKGLRRPEAERIAGQKVELQK
jgi:hypothetical protein